MLIQLIEESQTEQALSYIALHSSEELQIDDLINHALRKAGEYGDMEVLSALIDKGADVNFNEMLSCVSYTVLNIVAENGHLDIVKELLKHPEKIFNGTYGSAFISAAENGHLDIVKELLKHPEKISSEYSSKAFAAAAKKKYLDIVKDLWIDHSIRIYDATRLQVFQHAAENGHLDVFIELVKLNAQRIYSYDYGRALEGAAANGHLNVLEKLLREYLSKISDEAYGRALEGAAANGHLNVLEKLLREHSSKISNEAYGRALKGAAANRHLDVLEKLLREHLEEISDEAYGRALEGAAAKGHLDVLEKLLCEHSCKISNEAYGWALEGAADNGHLDVVEKLLLPEYSSKISDEAYGSALVSAANKGYLVVIEKLGEKLWNGISSEILNQACGVALEGAAANGHIDIVKMLVHKPTVEISQARYSIAFRSAAGNRHLDVIKVLLENPDKITDKIYSWVFADVVRKLEASWVVREKAYNGEGTDYLVEFRKGNFDFVKILLKHPGKISDDTYGKAFRIAVVYKGEDLTKLLLESEGGILKIVNTGGNPIELTNILYFIQKNGYQLNSDVIEVLTIKENTLKATNFVEAGQDTHDSSITSGVGKSLNDLKEYYPLTDELIETKYKEAKDFMLGDAYKNFLINTGKSEEEAAELAAAAKNDVVNRLEFMLNCGQSFVHVESSTPFKHAVALIWSALSDEENLERINNEAGLTDEAAELNKAEIKLNFMKKLIEANHEYIPGETDFGSATGACKTGTFNKIIAAADNVHPAVDSYSSLRPQPVKSITIEELGHPANAEKLDQLMLCSFAAIADDKKQEAFDKYGVELDENLDREVRKAIYQIIKAKGDELFPDLGRALNYKDVNVIFEILDWKSFVTSLPKAVAEEYLPSSPASTKSMFTLKYGAADEGSAEATAMEDDSYLVEQALEMAAEVTIMVAGAAAGY